MTKNYIYWLACIVALSGCQQKQAPEEAVSEENSQEQQMEKEVMAVHDQAMQKIEPIMSLRSELKEHITLLKKDPSKVDQVILEEMLVQNLDDAQHGMMAWMRSHNSNKDVTDLQERIRVLEEEKVVIQEIDKQMSKAIDAAEAALGTD